MEITIPMVNCGIWLLKLEIHKKLRSIGYLTNYNRSFQPQFLTDSGNICPKSKCYWIYFNLFTINNTYDSNARHFKSMYQVLHIRFPQNFEIT